MMSTEPSTEINSSAAKLVFAGPVGAGKTTAIRAVAGGNVVSTEMPLSGGPMGDKTTTTVALDFASVALADGTPLLIYGLPGQEHFAFMRGIIIEGALGVVLMLNGSDGDAASQCSHWMAAIRDISADVTVVVGVTQSDRSASFSLGAIRNAARFNGRAVPIFTLDARNKEECIHLVRALLIAAQ